jgi:hypothetical protein
MVHIKRILVGAIIFTGFMVIVFGCIYIYEYISINISPTINEILGVTSAGILFIALLYCLGAIFIRLDGEA